MKLIDRDAIHWRPDENWELYATAADIRAIPTVDAVVVTRCKDCKHYRNHPNGLCYLHTEPKENKRGYSGEPVCVEPDDFCSYLLRERGEGGDYRGGIGRESAIRRMHLCCVYVTIQREAQKGKRKFPRPW